MGDILSIGKDCDSVNLNKIKNKARKGYTLVNGGRYPEANALFQEAWYELCDFFVSTPMPDSRYLSPDFCLVDGFDQVLERVQDGLEAASPRRRENEISDMIQEMYELESGAYTREGLKRLEELYKKVELKVMIYKHVMEDTPESHEYLFDFNDYLSEAFAVIQDARKLFSKVPGNGIYRGSDKIISWPLARAPERR